MAAFPTSHLSQENVLRDVHDPVTQRLRVDAQTSMTPGQVEVVISQTDDSIRIGDGVNLITATVEGGKTGLDVHIDNTDILLGGEVYTNYNEVTGIASGVLTTILTYTAVLGDRLQQVDVAGTNISEYTVLVNGTVIDKRYTYFQNLNEHFNLNRGLLLTAGQVVEIKTIHNRPVLGDFNARLQIVR